jgi:hypothetical protein
MKQGIPSYRTTPGNSFPKLLIRQIVVLKNSIRVRNKRAGASKNKTGAAVPFWYKARDARTCALFHKLTIGGI